MNITISIADCNHGFWDPEYEECHRIAIEKNISINLKIHNCKQNEIIEKCQGSDIIAVQRLQLNGDIIREVPSCKVIVRLGVGLDNIDLSTIGSAIKVIYFPGFCTDEVANHTLALILSIYRRLWTIYQDKQHLSEYWGKSTWLHGVRKANLTTIGILGFGRIGRALAARLLPCGFRVLGCDPYVDSNDFGVRNVKKCSIDELLSTSDILSINCALTKETNGMIDDKLISKMKHGSSIVNTARGQIINTSSLEKYLRDGKIKFACVDVCDPEPISAGLMNVPNLYVTPHIAFYSWDSLDWLKRQFIQQSVSAVLDAM